MIRVLSGTVSGFVPPYSSTAKQSSLFVSNYDSTDVRQEYKWNGPLSAHNERSFRHWRADGLLYKTDSNQYSIHPSDVQLVESNVYNDNEYWLDTEVRYSIPGIPPTSLWAAAGPPQNGFPVAMWGFTCDVSKQKRTGKVTCHYTSFWYAIANDKQYTYQYFSIGSAWWYPTGTPSHEEILDELLSHRVSTTTWVEWDRRPHPACVHVNLRPIRHIPSFIQYAQYRKVLDDSPDIQRDRRYLLSDLSQDIADHASDLDINSIAYAKEFCDNIVSLYRLLQGDFSSLVGARLVGDRSTAALLRTAADAELSASYGLTLTIADTQELLAHFQRTLDSYKYAISRAQGEYSYTRGDVSYHENHYLKVWYSRSCSGFQGLLNDLFDKDAFLSLQNVWDLIPYSFVVDWAIPVEQFLNQQDANTRLSVLPISEVLRTVKTEITFSSTAVAQLTAGLGGQINVTLYERDANASLPPIYPHYQGRDQFQSWLQAGALITQKILK